MTSTMTATTTTATKNNATSKAKLNHHDAANAAAAAATTTTTTTHSATKQQPVPPPASPISVTSTTAAAAEPWKISRWSALQEKRLALSKQRVALERRLFESAPQFTESTTTSTNNNNNNTASAETLVQDMEVALASKEGATWSGPLDEKSGLPQGKGKMAYKNGQVYEGEVDQVSIQIQKRAVVMEQELGEFLVAVK